MDRFIDRAGEKASAGDAKRRAYRMAIAAL